MNGATVILVVKYIATSEGGNKDQHTGLSSRHIHFKGCLHPGDGGQLYHVT
jgi:hypothetical protein